LHEVRTIWYPRSGERRNPTHHTKKISSPKSAKQRGGQPAIGAQRRKGKKEKISGSREAKGQPSSKRVRQNRKRGGGKGVVRYQKWKEKRAGSPIDEICVERREQKNSTRRPCQVRSEQKTLGKNSTEKKWIMSEPDARPSRRRKNYAQGRLLETTLPQKKASQPEQRRNC